MPQTTTQASGETLLSDAQKTCQAERVQLEKLTGRQAAEPSCYCLTALGLEGDMSSSLSSDLFCASCRMDGVSSIYLLGFEEGDIDGMLTKGPRLHKDIEWFGPTESSYGDIDDEEGELVIARSALPKGSSLFEQVLDEVAPEMRITNGSAVAIACSRPQSLKERPFTGESPKRTEKKAHVCWADQKGFPLTSAMVFEG